MNVFRKTRGATRIATLLFFVMGALPRSATYVHSHAGSDHVHVHAWDGARLDDMRQLIDAAQGAHEHPHPHPSDSAAGEAHRHDPSEHASASTPRRDRTRGPVVAAAPTPTTEHTHSQPPFQTVATCAVLGVPGVVALRTTTPVVSIRAVERARPALRARAPPLSAQA